MRKQWFAFKHCDLPTISFILPDSEMSLHHLLRDSTADLHLSLDSGIDLNAVSKSEQNLADYLEKFHKGLALSWSALDWRRLEEMKLNLLTNRIERYEALSGDLSAWGRKVCNLPAGLSASDAQAVGIAYVLEGSMHGGRAIASQVRKNQGAQAFDRVLFLRGFGDETGKYWSSFLDWLSTLPSNGTFQAECCSAARWTFENFIGIMQPSPPAYEATAR